MQDAALTEGGDIDYEEEVPRRLEATHKKAKAAWSKAKQKAVSGSDEASCADCVVA